MQNRNLNTEQIQAINAPSGHNLVIASAGTGKTSTIVGRIAHLLRNGIEPQHILLLTFTNKAASEMLNRVGVLFPKEVDYITAGTFHGVGYKLLKQLDIEFILKQPSELRTIFKSAYEEHIGDIKNNTYASNGLYDLYSYYNNTCPDMSFGDFLIKREESQLEHSKYYEKIILSYEEIKKTYHYMGFDDLLLASCKYLQESDLTFDEVLVDEYQDTNPLQNKFINTAFSKSLFCVGDYDQSIYSFNGSDISIINGFAQNYTDANVYNLSKNYRSTKPILNLANRVISHNKRIYPKKLEVIRDDLSINPKLLIYNELFEQYQDIAKRIQTSSYDYPHIAIIFRNNSSADGIEISLKELQIPVRRKGGISFFETREIKAIFDLISIVIYKKDMISFINILNYSKGIGNTASKSIFDALILLGDNIVNGFLNPKNINPFANIQENLFGDTLVPTTKTYSNINTDFAKNPILQYPKINENNIHYLEDLYNLLQKTKFTKNPTELIDTIIKSKTYTTIKNTLAKQRATLKNGSLEPTLQTEALANIDNKTNLLKDISKHYKDIKQFVNAMTLSGNEVGSKNGVNLLTVHSSKGLEFNEVYVIDLMDGRFPNNKLMSKNKGSLEEERRLFYVSVTRAKDVLILSYAKSDRLKNVQYDPSIFLKEAKLL
jgi:DNA helicase-2/ATP-dependent DNA helicase PcrA